MGHDASPPLPDTTVVLVDDDRRVARGLSSVLPYTPDLRTLGAEGDGWPAAAGVGPAVVVIDRRSGPSAQRGAVRPARVRPPQVRVVVVAADADGGPDGDDAIADLVEVLRAVVHPPASRRPGDGGDGPGPAGGAGLTGRELEVLEALGDGHTPADIARRLCLSEHTVRNHIRHVLAKLGAHSRLQAVAVAARAGILDLRSTRTPDDDLTGRRPV